MNWNNVVDWWFNQTKRWSFDGIIHGDIHNKIVDEELRQKIGPYLQQIISWNHHMWILSLAMDNS